MRHSSRILRILVILLAIPATAVAGGAIGQAPTVGSARGLSPIRPVVGAARNLSPVRPVVGFARPHVPFGSNVDGRRRFATGANRRSVRDRTFGGGFDGFGFAGAGLYGPGPAYGSGDDAGTDAVRPFERSDERPFVLMAPPPCVHPQIISIGRSVHAARPAARRKEVRVVYGRPPCGAD